MKTDKETIDRILVATDGSEESLGAARYAALLVRGLGARVTLLHVIPNEDIPLGTTQLTHLTRREEIETEKALWEGAQAILEGSREPFEELSVPVEGLIRRGEAAQEILAAAREEPFDLVVVASRGAGGASRALLGSTSDAVVREALCPVLVVRKGLGARG